MSERLNERDIEDICRGYDALQARYDALSAELKDANYWRERWSNEWKAASDQSQKHWEEIQSLKAELEQVKAVARKVVTYWDSLRYPPSNQMEEHIRVLAALVKEQI